MSNELWFRKRRVDEGQGYSVTGAKGVIVMAGFAIALTLALVVPPFVGKASPASLAISAVFAAIWVWLLVRTLKRHSDWRG